jgi:hypothetical protein
MRATIDRVSASIAVTLRIIDISGDPELEARYGLEIPVLLVDGKKAAKYRVSQEDLIRILAGRRKDTTSGREG